MGKQDFPRRSISHDNFPSDEWILDMFEDWFDPCPLNPTWVQTGFDGLSRNWKNKTFVNPPYSNPKPWVEKAIKENQLGKTIVLLLKHDSSTEWYRLLSEARARFLIINGRLNYGQPRNAAFPSVLAVLSKSNTRK